MVFQVGCSEHPWGFQRTLWGRWDWKLGIQTQSSSCLSYICCVSLEDFIERRGIVAKSNPNTRNPV